MNYDKLKILKIGDSICCKENVLNWELSVSFRASFLNDSFQLIPDDIRVYKEEKDLTYLFEGILFDRYSDEVSSHIPYSDINYNRIKKTIEWSI